jgi:outer membrane lipoprotein-sorting protein
MKSLKFSLIAITSLFSLLTHAQTADEIINKHINAMGGKDKITQIKSLQIESVMNVMGNDAPMTTTILNGKGFKNEVDFNGSKIIQVYTDKGGWSINPMMGSADAQPMPQEQFKAGKSEINVGGPFINYAAEGNKVELQGKEKIGAVDAYKLVLTSKDSSSATFYIDPATYYIVKTVRTLNMNGQTAELAVVFSDYRKTDYGFVVPFSIETTLPQGLTMTSSVKKVEVNKEVDPKIFDMPKS